MRLTKLYSSNEKFNDIYFSKGVNIILADIDDTNIEASIDDSKALEHNLGKTALLHLIDFMLLKGDLFVTEHLREFKLEQEDWTFFLEIKLNRGDFLTIKRSFNKPSKISFKVHTEEKMDFRELEGWDHKDLGLSSKKENPKDIFQGEYLNFKLGNDTTYRHFLGYLLRTQDDYQDVFRLNNFRGADKTWKPQLFELLGFSYSLLSEKYSLSDSVEEIEQKIKGLEYSPEKDDINKIDAILEAKKNERKTLSEKIDQFNFFDNDQAINSELTQDIVNEIALLNKEEYKINLNLREIEKSLNSANVNTKNDYNTLEILFSEIKVIFPDSLKKSFDDLIKFSNQITSERKKVLTLEKTSLELQKTNIKERLFELNTKWSDKLGIITETDGFRKYDKYRENMAGIDAEIMGLNSKKDLYQRYKKLEEEKKRLERDLDTKIDEIKTEVNENKELNVYYKKISHNFTKFYKEIFEGTAVIYPQVNNADNIDFKYSVQNNQNSESGKGKGNTSKMALCASFALALILSYYDNSFFRFTYLDGAFEGWGDEHKKKFVDIVRKYSEEYDVQVILTIIKSDIPDDLIFSDFEIKKRLYKGKELFGIKY